MQEWLRWIAQTMTDGAASFPGDVVVLHAGEADNDEARLLADAPDIDSEHKVADVLPGCSFEVREPFVVALPDGKRPIRLVPGRQNDESGPAASPWLLGRISRAVPVHRGGCVRLRRRGCSWIPHRRPVEAGYGSSSARRTGSRSHLGDARVGGYRHGGYEHGDRIRRPPRCGLVRWALAKVLPASDSGSPSSALLVGHSGDCAEQSCGAGVGARLRRVSEALPPNRRWRQ